MISTTEWTDLIVQWGATVAALYAIVKRKRLLLFAIVGTTIWLLGCASQPAPIILQAPVPMAQATPTPVVTDPKPTIPPDPLANLRPDVRDVIQRGIEPTLQDGITTIYPYSPDVQYPLRAMPMHAVEIRLAPDEATDEKSVIVGDPDRWSLKVSPQTVLIEPKATAGYVDPASKQWVPQDPHMVTTLTISTTKRRSYNYIAKMVSRNPTQAVECYYSEDVKQALAARQLALRAAAKEKQ